jgi:hypothetical protein
MTIERPAPRKVAELDGPDVVELFDLAAVGVKAGIERGDDIEGIALAVLDAMGLTNGLVAGIVREVKTRLPVEQAREVIEANVSVTVRMRPRVLGPIKLKLVPRPEPLA